MNWKNRFSEIRVGDTVICVEESSKKHKESREPFEKGAGWIKGKKFTVDDINRHNIVWPKTGCGVFLNYVRKV